MIEKRIPKAATVPIQSNDEYWESHRHGPELPSMKTPCHDCAITTGFYMPYADELKEQPIEVQRDVIKRWFCHNHPNRACKGVSDLYKNIDPDRICSGRSPEAEPIRRNNYMSDKIQEIRTRISHHKAMNEQEGVGRDTMVIPIDRVGYLLTELDAAKQENERLKDERNLSLRNLENGAMRAGGEPALTFYKMLVELFQKNGGKNFLTLTVEKPDKSERYAITIQNLNGELSPAEKMESLQQQLKQAIEALESYAKPYDTFCGSCDQSVTIDDGELARETLAIIREGKEPTT